MRAMFAFARDADQIPTEGCSAATIMRAAQFARGLADVRAGRAPDYDGTDLDAYWAYERGRQFGCIAPLNMPLRVGSKLNGRALALFKAAISRGADPMSTRTLVAIEADLHAALKVDARNAIKIGRLLLEAQRQIFRGKWLPWLRENFALTERTAQNYMRAPKLAAKNETVSDLQAAYGIVRGRQNAA